MGGIEYSGKHLVERWSLLRKDFDAENRSRTESPREEDRTPVKVGGIRVSTEVMTRSCE